MFPTTPDLAVFFPKIEDRRYGVTADSPKPRIGLGFLNLGASSCLIRASRVEIFFGKDLPPAPTFSYSKEYVGETPCGTSNTGDKIGYELDRHMTKEEIKGVKNGEIPINVMGYVKYVDIFGFIHTKGFCIRATYDEVGPYWQIVGGAPYNYRWKDRVSEDQRL
jgi:hypothetical protein